VLVEEKFSRRQSKGRAVLVPLSQQATYFGRH
jgi:hypothetical protein